MTSSLQSPPLVRNAIGATQGQNRKKKRSETRRNALRASLVLTRLSAKSLLMTSQKSSRRKRVKSSAKNARSETRERSRRRRGRGVESTRRLIACSKIRFKCQRRMSC